MFFLWTTALGRLQYCFSFGIVTPIPLYPPTLVIFDRSVIPRITWPGKSLLSLPRYCQPKGDRLRFPNSITCAFLRLPIDDRPLSRRGSPLVVYALRTRKAAPPYTTYTHTLMLNCSVPSISWKTTTERPKLVRKFPSPKLLNPKLPNLKPHELRRDE